MTNGKIADIRARHEAGERASAVTDREWLLGEVERLRCTSRDLLDTLSAAVRSGDFALSGSKDMAEFVRQALRNLEEIAR